MVRNLDRRAFLSAAAAMAVTGTAGCSGDDGNAPTETPAGATDSMTETSDTMGAEGAETADGMDGTETADGMDGTETADGMDGTETAESLAAWRTIELTGVLTDETFTIAELDGPVVIQSFAVWCPKCERQSKNLQDVDDSITVVGLNTDPNEDAEKVQQHAESNGFDWRFAVSPTEMTDALVGAFGSAVTVAPSTPLIVACEGGTAEFRSGSILSAEEIKSVATNC